MKLRHKEHRAFIYDPVKDETKELNLIRINNGIFIDGKEIKGITEVQVSAAVDEMSEITIKFNCNIEGLDYIDRKN